MVRRGQRAFTLIELLVVVAVMAILASLLFPGVTKAVDRSRSSKCSNNLRQIGVAVLLFASDHQGLLPPNYMDGVPQRPADVPVGDLGTQLNPYAQYKSTTYHCPSAKIKITKPDAMTYAAHAEVLVKFIENGYRLRDMSEIKRPLSVLMLADTTQIYADGSGGPDLTGPSGYRGFSNPAQADQVVDLAGNPDSSGVKGIRYRHINDEQANFIYVDGHVGVAQSNLANRLRQKNFALAY